MIFRDYSCVNTILFKYSWLTKYKIEIKNGNALPVDYLNKELKPESAYNRLHDELDVVFEQIRELRALVEDIEWRVRTLEMSASDDEVDGGGI